MQKLLNTKHLFFAFIILAQVLVYNYPYILKIEPRTVHAWRQFDCLSFAQHFYDNSATLTEPRINNLGYKGNGKTASEFPIVPYIVGNIWKITGIHSSIYKLVNLLFLFLGLFFIYKLFLLELKDKILSTLITALIFTSPILSYYGVSTISDIQSFSLSMMGFYFFYRWTGTNTNGFFITFIILFSLAGLIKASSGLVYLVCIIFFMLQKLLKKEPFLFRKHNRILAPSLAIPVLIWISWYTHAKHYNELNNDGFFLVGLLPAWNLPPAQLQEVFHKFVHTILPQVFSPVLLYALLFTVLFSIFPGGKSNSIARWILTACLFLFITFIILFFEAMDVHDYYLINAFGLIVIALFFITKIWHEKLVAFNRKRVIIVLSVLVMVFSYLSGIKTWKKINCNVTNFENKLVFNVYEQKNYFWIYWLDREMYKILEDKTLDIEKAGVLPSDTIFCLGDNTINRVLYMLRRQGYSNFNAKPEEVPAFIHSHPNIKFIVLIDPTLKKKTYLNLLLSNKIFEKESLSVYRLK
jgi:hypothetical protein